VEWIVLQLGRRQCQSFVENRLPSAPAEKHKNVLGYLFGDQSRAAHVQGEAKDGSLPPAVERSEGIFVSGQRLRKQLFVGSLGQQLHLEG